MGWLKDEVKEITRIVAEWPAWKRGESEGRMICFTESELQQHEEQIINKAMAKKDVELTRLKNEVDLHRMLSKDSKRYDMLMAQAVRFAQLAGAHAPCQAAYDFLQSPEVQAFMKEHKS